MAHPITVIRNDNGVVQFIRMPRPSNFHSHLRLDAIMRAVASNILCWVKHLLVMPNDGRVDTLEKVAARYVELSQLAEDIGCKPSFIITIYFTEKLTPRVINKLMVLPFPVAVKYYPPHKGATTGSGYGIPLTEAPESLREMEQCNTFLLGHFESVYDAHGRELPMQEREEYFMRNEFPWLRETYPNLHINIEHASTAYTVSCVKADETGKTTCGFTPHHLLLSLDALKKKSWANHGRCMPIPKTQEDVDVCRKFAASGDWRTHLGDDTAPHLSAKKVGMPFDEAACGVYLPHSLALYALAFEMERALDSRFVDFACLNGPRMWNLPFPERDETVVLKRDTTHDIPEPTPVPEENDVIIPLGWTTADESDRLRIGLTLSL